MRIGHLERFVRDPQESLQFYRDVLGWEVVAVQGERFAWLKCGDVEVLLRPGTPGPGGATYREGGQAIVLYTADLEATMAELEQRGLVFEGTDGSAKCPTFRDPDGYWFQLVAPG